MKDIFLNIADIPVWVCLDQEKPIGTEFANFTDRNLPAEPIRVYVQFDLPPGPETPIRVEARDRGFSAGGDDFRVEFDGRTKTARARLCALEGAFNHFLRVFFSLVIADYQGLMLHAAGLAIQGQGFVFPGVSSSGKTTLAGMSAPESVLSDELVILRRQARGGYRIYATPFGGEYKGIVRRQSAELEAIFFLGRHSQPNPRRLGQTESFLRLMENTFFFLRDGHSHQRMLDLVKDLSAKIVAGEADFFTHDLRSVLNGYKDSFSAQPGGSLAASRR